jgi:colanic acid/amylovoran biosynthesis glycosyltransferase
MKPVGAQRRPVVAHVVRGYLPATESFVHNQVTRANRYETRVVCHHRQGSEFPNAQCIAATDTMGGMLKTIDRLSDRLTRTPLPRAMDTMAQDIVASGACVLHFHYLVNARTYLPLKSRTGLPAVVSAYGYDVSRFPRRFGGLGRRYLSPMLTEVDYVLAISRTMSDDLIHLGVPEDRVRVHYHGIDTDRFAAPARRYEPSKLLTVLCCARLTRAKGQRRLVEALARVRDQSNLGFRLVFVGDGPDHREIEQTVNRLRMGDVVQLAGHVPHLSDRLPAHYRAADVFALASTSERGEKEGIPGALVEAMAAGLPVVATRHGGIPEVVDDGHDGLLVEEADVGALARAIERLLADASLRRRLGTAAALRAARDLDLRVATTGLELLYDEMAARSKSTRPEVA